MCLFSSLVLKPFERCLILVSLLWLPGALRWDYNWVMSFEGASLRKRKQITESYLHKVWLFIDSIFRIFCFSGHTLGREKVAKLIKLLKFWAWKFIAAHSKELSLWYALTILEAQWQRTFRWMTTITLTIFWPHLIYPYLLRYKFYLKVESLTASFMLFGYWTLIVESLIMGYITSRLRSDRSYVSPYLQF